MKSTEECQECGEDFPLNLLMKGTQICDDGYSTFEMTVPVCRGCTDSTKPWLDGDKVSDDFTAAIKSIEERGAR